MSTWIDDIKDPELKKAYQLVGNQDTVCLKNMVKALSMCTFLNTKEDGERLRAARLILKSRSKKK